MLRQLFTRRWLSLFGLLAVVVPAFVALGFWQLDRYDQRRAGNAVIERNATADPVPLEALIAIGEPVSAAIEWRPVMVVGQYDDQNTLLVRNRTARDNGPPGFHVLTPLVTRTGAALLVDRGWIPYGETAASTPSPPAPPAGDVTVTGWLHRSERPGSHAGDLPAGQITRIDATTIGANLPYPAYDGYIELTVEEPAVSPAPVLLEPPRPNAGPHLSYAVQWFLFAAIAVGGFGYLFVREAREVRAQERPRAFTPSQEART